MKCTHNHQKGRLKIRTEMFRDPSPNQVPTNFGIDSYPICQTHQGREYKTENIKRKNLLIKFLFKSSKQGNPIITVLWCACFCNEAELIMSVKWKITFKRKITLLSNLLFLLWIVIFKNVQKLKQSFSSAPIPFCTLLPLSPDLVQNLWHQLTPAFSFVLSCS